MEHILQFGISIDENKIVDRAIEMASQKMVSDLEGKMFPRYGGFSHDMETVINAALEPHMEEIKSEIIKRTSEKLYASLTRTQKYREAINKALAEVDE